MVRWLKDFINQFKNLIKDVGECTSIRLDNIELKMKVDRCNRLLKDIRAYYILDNQMYREIDEMINHLEGDI